MTETLSLALRVGIPDGIVYRDLRGELVLLNLKTGVYFGLDPIGTRIWQLLQDRSSLQEVLDALLQEYEVAEAECREHLVDFVLAMRKNGLVEISDATAT
jgi:hypothetical protein